MMPVDEIKRFFSINLKKRIMLEKNIPYEFTWTCYEPQIDGEYYISEVNPRFGGGYPHAYECGCDHMKLIENNLEGNSNKPVIGTYKSDIYMMKYNEICIKNFEV